MKLFEKRPLCLILCIMLGGFSLFAGKEYYYSLIAVSVSLLLFALTFIVKTPFIKNKLLLRLVFLFFSISVLLSVLWTASYFPAKYYNEPVKAVGIVTNADHTDTTGSTLIFRTDKINGERARYTVILYGDKDELSGINAGDEISVSFTPQALSGSGSFDSRSYYISKGYSASSTDPTDVELLSKGNYTLNYYFERARQNVTAKFKLISNEDTGGFLAALLTGERDEMDANTNINFTRLGISHILALSGSHLVILSFAVACLLRLFPLNKKWKTAILIVFVLGYMALTGMSASVTRAGIMMIISSLLYLLSRKSDSITSLTISVAVIILLQPYAVFDISLWLSASATLGIIFMSNIKADTGKVKTPLKKLLNWLFVSLVSSVFAISASFIICLLNFDTFSTLGVIATLIFTPLTEVLIYCALIGLIVGSFIPMNLPLVMLTECIKELAELMSSPSFALISLDFIPVRILIILLTVFFYAVLVLGDKRNVKLCALMICIIFCLINAVGIVQSTVVRNSDEVIYSPNSSTDVIVVKSEGKIASIASGCSKYSLYEAVNVLSDERITSIEYLILPSYTYYTCEQVLATVGSIRVNYLLLPEPMTTVELADAERISEELSKYGCDLKFYADETPVEIGDATYYLIERMHKNEASTTRNIFTVKYDGEYITYCSRGATDYASSTSLFLIDSSASLIIGANGKAQTEFGKLSSSATCIYFGYDYVLTESATDFYDERDTEIFYVTEPTPVK